LFDATDAANVDVDATSTMSAEYPDAVSECRFGTTDTTDKRVQRGVETDVFGELYFELDVSVIDERRIVRASHVWEQQQ
jgi:hypothetical protein